MSPATATQAAAPAETASLLDQITDEQIEREEKRFDLIQRKSNLVAASRCYPDTVIPEVAAIKMMTADLLKVDPMVGVTDIRVFEGKPELSAGLTAALLQREGFTWKFVRYDDQEVSALWWFKGEPLANADGSPLQFAFTMEQADRAGYSKRGVTEKNPLNNYQKVPENMLFARMITNFCKHHAPWVTRGMTIYAPGEVEAAVGDRLPAGFVEPERVAATEGAAQ